MYLINRKPLFVCCSPYHRHSADIATIIKPTALADRDIVRTSLYLEPTHSRHSGYTEDYLATEV